MQLILKAQKLISEVIVEFGTIDILINNKVLQR